MKKKIIGLLLTITLILSNFNVALAVKSTLVDKFVDEVFKLENKNEFIDLLALFNNVNNKTGILTAYQNAFGVLATGQKRRLESFGLSTKALTAFSNYVNDEVYSIDNLKNYLKNDKQEEFKKVISDRTSEFETELKNEGADINKLENGFSKMDKLFQFLAVAFEVNKDGFSDLYNFFEANQSYGTLSINITRAKDVIDLANTLLDDKIEDKDSVINAFNRFTDYYNGCSSNDKKAIFDYLNQYGFIKIKSSGGVSGSGGGSLNSVESTLSILKIQNMIERAMKIDSIETSKELTIKIIKYIAQLKQDIKINEKDLKELQEKLIQVIEKILKNAGNIKIDKNDIKIKSGKVSVKVNEQQLLEKNSKIQYIKNTLEKEMIKNRINEDKKTETKVTIDIPYIEGNKQLEVILPPLTGILDTIDKVQVCSEFAEFGITKETFGKDILNKEIVLSVKKVNKKDIPIEVTKQIPQDASIIDLNAFVGGVKTSQFKAPMQIAIPYILKEGQNPMAVTVFLLKDNGEIEAVGGRYDETLGKVVFMTNHFSKYFIKESVKSFNDIKTSWARKYIEILAGKGIINGKGENKFDPDSSVTRAEFVTLIVNMLKLKGNVSELKFVDVPKDAWYAPYVGAANQAKLIKGKSDTIFAPNSLITREEMAVIITNVLEVKGYNKVKEQNLTVFKDCDQISSWAVDSIKLAYYTGIINGRTKTMIVPKANATRAEAAKIIYKVFEK